MKRWKYALLDNSDLRVYANLDEYGYGPTDAPRVSAWESAQRVLNERGAEGWELVAVTDDPRAYIFRRPIEGGS